MINITAEQQSILDSALAKWGVKDNMLITIEELSEMIDVISKNIGLKQVDNADKIPDAIADVLVVMNVAMQAYKIPESEVQKIFDEKISRLKAKL